MDSFIGGLKKRGLSGVELLTSDSHPTIRTALREHYSRIPWQRCQYHVLDNALNKVLKTGGVTPGGLATDLAKRNTGRQTTVRLEELNKELEEPLPDVANWLRGQARVTLTFFWVAPSTRRRRPRMTNTIGRFHQELKRSSKPVQIFPNPDSCLPLFGALLKEQHEDWINGRRYLKMEQLEEFRKNENLLWSIL